MPKVKIAHCFFLLMIVFGFSTCTSPKEVKQTIYENNFDAGNTANLSNTKISSFNQSKVLGNFNNDGFTLSLNQIPPHELLEITFDLYIHDTWDGNKTSNGIDGPDIWEMQVDGTPYTLPNLVVINLVLFSLVFKWLKPFLKVLKL